VSTEISLECRSHDPVLQDGEVVGHNLGQCLDQVRLWIQRRDELIDLAARQRALDFDPFETTDDYYRRTLAFILEHPRCTIGIRDEYGKDHPIDPEETSS
jgi:hypothetical protein